MDFAPVPELKKKNLLVLEPQDISVESSGIIRWSFSPTREDNAGAGVNTGDSIKRTLTVALGRRDCGLSVVGCADAGLNGAKTPVGVFVSKLQPGSPAEDTALCVGDLIVRVDSHKCIGASAASVAAWLVAAPQVEVEVRYDPEAMQGILALAEKQVGWVLNVNLCVTLKVKPFWVFPILRALHTFGFFLLFIR